MNDYAANLGFFLLDKTGSIYGQWSGRMKAADQRRVFGRFLGKGRIDIDGALETLSHTRTVCFGLDFETTAELKWAQL